jgi:HK97 gp10 family phage protein
MAKQISLAQFQQRMRKADQRLVKTLFTKLRALSLKAEAEAKRNATDYPRVRTGRLRSSITGLVDTKNARPRLLLVAGGNTKGAPVNYARFVEFGTKYMRPRLFMGRAMQKIERNEVMNELRNLLNLALVER